MNVRRNVIIIDSRKANTHRKQSTKQRYERYVDIRHKIFKEHTVVTPFDRSQLENEGYKV